MSRQTPAGAKIPRKPCVLAVNGGSSSIRFALFEAAGRIRRVLGGKMDRIGLAGTTLDISESSGRRYSVRLGRTRDHAAAVMFLLGWLERQGVLASVHAVGHRVVHGMRHFEPEAVTGSLLRDLRGIIPYDPEHLPREIGMIELFRRRHPRLLQVACFDTAFHRTMPRVARTLALPRRYGRRGVTRYGFHGLSYTFLMEELRRLGDPAARRGRVVLAHLGNGASMAAVRDGRSVDTSMGFTPAAGLVMSTRSGDLDPGLVSYLARTEGMTAAQFQRMVTHESGVLGISGTSPDMRDLLAREARDPRAAEAVELFCYQAMKWVGSYAAVLGGLDTLVFAGGIGENAPAVRARICGGLGFLGVRISARRNAANAAVISTDASRVTVRVIPTDEEWVVAQSALRMLRHHRKRHSHP